jgi:hypothetical protein
MKLMDKYTSFKINVTDGSGNSNVSATTTIVVTNDTSFYNFSSIPLIKSFTYGERLINNSLGEIYLNNILNLYV